jgi:hypothetical protein
VGTLARPGQKCYQRLTLCLVGGYGRVLDAAGMREVGTGIRTRMKVRKQNESGTFPDSFFILEESVPPSFSPRKFKIMSIEARVLPVVNLRKKAAQIEFFDSTSCLTVLCSRGFGLSTIRTFFENETEMDIIEHKFQSGLGAYMSVGWLVLALVAGSVVLNIVGPLRGMSEKRMGVYKSMLPGMQVEVTSENLRTWLAQMTLAAMLLEVIVPGVIYAVLAEELDRSGVLFGMLFWGGAWLIGSLPPLVFEPMLIHVPRRVVIHNIVWSLLVYLVIGAVVGLIYPVS